MSRGGARRAAVRLRVVYRRVTCPFGRNDGQGGRDLHDCYLDSLTPGHACRDPEATGATRCPQVAVFAQTHGLRTYQVQPEVTSVDAAGRPHQDHRVFVTYHPLDLTSEHWYAMNAYTGERYEVVLRAETPHRVTPEGEAIEQTYRMVDSQEMTVRAKTGGMVTIPYREPIWRGAPSRDEHQCRCADCTAGRKGTMNDEKKDEDENLDDEVRALTAPFGRKPGLRRASDVPSAGSMFGTQIGPQKTGDPDCAKCKTDTSPFRACPEHRVRPSQSRASSYQGAMAGMFGRPPTPTASRKTTRILDRRVARGEAGDERTEKPRRRENVGPGSIVSAGFRELTRSKKKGTP